ncbi:MAG: RDD family protein [Rhodanobacter sp.]
MPALKQLLVPKRFKAHSAPRQLSLEGCRLAPFQRRAIAIAVDLIIFNLALIAGSILWGIATSNLPSATTVNVVGLDTWWALAAVVVYFGTLTYVGHGQTPGKRLLGIRVVPLVHDRVSFWHSVEQALGYGASALELGFGFLQYFIHPNAQTVHDRIAETIVVSERATP